MSQPEEANEQTPPPFFKTEWTPEEKRRWDRIYGPWHNYPAPDSPVFNLPPPPGVASYAVEMMRHGGDWVRVGQPWEHLSDAEKHCDALESCRLRAYDGGLVRIVTVQP